MAVQGMAFAIRARALWPGIALHETHPKVLYHALTHRRYDWGADMDSWLLGRIGCRDTASPASEHEWDALVSAWAAFSGGMSDWSVDLRGMSEDAIEPAGAVSYWWPSG